MLSPVYCHLPDALEYVMSLALATPLAMPMRSRRPRSSRYGACLLALAAVSRDSLLVRWTELVRCIWTVTWGKLRGRFTNGMFRPLVSVTLYAGELDCGPTDGCGSMRGPAALSCPAVRGLLGTDVSPSKGVLGSLVSLPRDRMYARSMSSCPQPAHCCSGALHGPGHCASF